MKKPVTILLIAVMLLGSSSISYAAGYTDVKSTNWAYEAVSTMSAKAVITGYPDGSFKPSNTVTYGEFIKMALIAATGEDVGNAENSSAATGGWAANYYNKSVELGYFTKADIAKSDRNAKITRAHMALIISSILGDVTIEDYDAIQEGITDITVKTAYEYDITKSYASGILTGYTDKTFRPEKTLTRAEAAAVIYRLVDESKRIYPGEETTTTAETTEQKVTIGFVNWDKTFEKTLKTAKLGDYGIAKIEVQSSGDVAIFSTVQYDKIVLLIDNVVVSSVGNVNGTSYWHENGYYIYVATPGEDGISTSGKTPSILISGLDDEIIQFTDVTL